MQSQFEHLSKDVNPSIRLALPNDATLVSDVLREAARWLDERGMTLWRDGELMPLSLASDVAAGLFFLAECDGRAAGTVRYQLEDQLFWPDVAQEQSAFIHRLAVRRRYAGTGIAGRF